MLGVVFVWFVFPQEVRVVWVDVCQCPFGMVMHSGVLSVLG